MAAGNSIIIVTIEEESFILVIRGSNIQGLWNCEVLKTDYAKHHPFNGWCLCCHLPPNQNLWDVRKVGFRLISNFVTGTERQTKNVNESRKLFDGVILRAQLLFKSCHFYTGTGTDNLHTGDKVCGIVKSLLKTDYEKHHPFNGWCLCCHFPPPPPPIRICDMWERSGSVRWVTLSLCQKGKLKMSTKVENFLMGSSWEPSCYSSPIIFTQGLVGMIMAC
jgi:hypothetical protein